MPRHSYSGPPSGEALDGDIASVQREFGRRLQAARLEKGWNQAELARAASKHMHDGKFGRDLIGPYERAERLPSPVHLSSLARALGKMANELLPYQGVPGSGGSRQAQTGADMKDAGDGDAWIKIHKKVPWAIAVQVMNILNPEGPKRG